MNRPLAAPLVGILAFGALAASVSAQPVLDVRERLDADRPEAWAMRWFAAALAPTGFGLAPEQPAGAVELALEAAWIPHLSAEQRTIGFDGTKTEDLNRSPFAAGPRVRVALPADWSLDATWLPPVEVDGARGNLLGVGAAKTLLERGRFRLGTRLSAIDGTFDGDFTCPADAVAAGEDPDRNPYRCEAASDDEVALTALALELAGAWRPAWARGVEFWVAGLVRHVDSTFQVDARYDGIIDRTRLDYSGVDWGLATGAGGRAGGRWRWMAELDWTPLDVGVEPVGRGHDVYDPMINLRLGLAYRLRR